MTMMECKDARIFGINMKLYNIIC